MGRQQDVLILAPPNETKGKTTPTACINNQRDSIVTQAVAQKPIVLSTKQLFRERCSNLCVLINLDGKHFGEKGKSPFTN